MYHVIETLLPAANYDATRPKERPGRLLELWAPKGACLPVCLCAYKRLTRYALDSYRTGWTKIHHTAS